MTPTGGIIDTIAGTGVTGGSGDGGPATLAQIGWPDGLAVDSSGDIFFADPLNAKVREIVATTGLMVTVAGTGASGFSGDSGAATAAQLNDPFDVAVDNSGHLFITDYGNDRIREVDLTSGLITTVVGNGISGFSGDGAAATDAELHYATRLATDGAGDLFVADTGNYRVREVNLTSGIITTVAGNGTPGFSGDGGPATAAEIGLIESSPQFDGVQGIAVDAASDLFIADAGANRIRRVDHATGVISTIAGTGSAGSSGDGGPATAAQLYNPIDPVLDSAGNLFFIDELNNTVREINLATGQVSTVAGNHSAGFSGDGGQATASELNYPHGLGVDTAGDLYIADTYNSRIREVAFDAAAAPTNLTVLRAGGQVTLSWTAPPGVAGYNVYRSTTPGGEGTTPYQTGILGTSFTDTSVIDGITYYYTVTAVNPAGEGGPSAEASALAGAGFRSDFSTPASNLPAPWQTVLGGGFSINSSDQAVSAPIIQGLFKAATVNSLSLTNVSVSADVGLSAAPANGTSAAAVIVRSQDANDINNCYFAALTPAPGGLDQILIEKTINGQITGIAAKALPAGTTSGTLTLDVFGNNLAAYLNGQLEVIGTDNTYTTAGQVGIGAQDQGATFANVVASELVSPPVPFTDEFSRPSSATLGNPWYVNYVVPPNSSTAPGGGFGINGSEQAVSLGAGANVASLFGINLSSTTVSATVVNAGAGAGVVADWNNATQSGYGLLLSGSTLQLYKVINGSPMPLGPGHAVGASSGLVGLQVSGGTLSVYFNGAFVFSLNDSTFTSGSAGLAASGAGVTFSGFSVTSS